jgi:cell division protein ZapA
MMSLVGVIVNGRDYQVACDDGQEERVKALAEYLDERVAELSAGVGQVGEARLLLMAALMIASDLADADQQIEALEAALADGGAEDGGAASGIADLAQRLENVVDRLENA